MGRRKKYTWYMIVLGEPRCRFCNKLFTLEQVKYIDKCESCLHSDKDEKKLSKKCSEIGFEIKEN